MAKIREGISRAKLLICVSKDTQQECEMRFPGIETVWIPHAINTEAYAVETERPDWFVDGVNLLVIGSEEARKRVDFAVKVCSELDVTLHKIGAESSPQSKQELCALAKDLGCNLNWVGRLESSEMIAALQQNFLLNDGLKGINLHTTRYFDLKPPTVLFMEGIDFGVNMQPVQSVAIIGAGNMGSGIAQKTAQEEFDVQMVDREAQWVERGQTIISDFLSEAVEEESSHLTKLNRLKGVSQGLLEPKILLQLQT